MKSCIALLGFFGMFSGTCGPFSFFFAPLPLPFPLPLPQASQHQLVGKRSATQLQAQKTSCSKYVPIDMLGLGLCSGTQTAEQAELNVHVPSQALHRAFTKPLEINSPVPSRSLNTWNKCSQRS